LLCTPAIARSASTVSPSPSWARGFALSSAHALSFQRLQSVSSSLNVFNNLGNLLSLRLHPQWCQQVGFCDSFATVQPESRTPASRAGGAPQSYQRGGFATVFRQTSRELAHMVVTFLRPARADRARQQLSRPGQLAPRVRLLDVDLWNDLKVFEVERVQPSLADERHRGDHAIGNTEPGG
jgi:hypothetical protein